MSQWTHVAGMIRVDALKGIVPFGTPGNPDLEKLLGPMCLYDNWNDASTLPKGSEGSLQYAVGGSPDDDPSLAAYVVSIWGDLRDYDNVDEIHEWLTKTFDGMMIRNGVVMVEVEYRETVILSYGDGQFTRIPVPAPAEPA